MDEPVTEEVIAGGRRRTAAWASFCQALLGGGVPLRQVNITRRRYRTRVFAEVRATCRIAGTTTAMITSRALRRQVLKSAGAGFGYLALAGLLGQNIARDRAATGDAPAARSPPGRRTFPSRPSGSSSCS